jgi:probable rRNA maturation factor
MSISIQNQQKTHRIDTGRLRRSLKRLLKKLDRKDCEISVVLIDDDRIRAMNKTYLNRDRTTNVISFPMAESSYGNVNPEILGDIIISTETAARDALCGRMDIMDELEFLLIHGLLHLMGYNHENTSAEKAEEMNKRERELFYMLRHYDLEP